MQYFGYCSIGDLQRSVSMQPLDMTGNDDFVSDRVYFDAIAEASAWVDTLYPGVAPFGKTTYRRVLKVGGTAATGLDVDSTLYEDADVVRLDRSRITRAEEGDSQSGQGLGAAILSLDAPLAYGHPVGDPLVATSPGQLSESGPQERWLERAVAAGERTLHVSYRLPLSGTRGRWRAGETVLLGTPPLIRRAVVLYGKYILYSMGQNFAETDENKQLQLEAENLLQVSRPGAARGNQSTGRARAKPDPAILLPEWSLRLVR